MKQIKYPIFLAILAFFACREDNNLLVSTGKLQGRVVEKSTGQPLADVEITTNPTSQKVFTAADGTFEIEGLAAGNYSVRAQKDQFLSQLEPFKLDGEDSTFVLIKLVNDSLDNSLPVPGDQILPANFAQNQPRDIVFRWKKADDADATDELKYGVLIFQLGSPDVDTVVWETVDTTANFSGLKYGATYLWQTVVADESGSPVFGPVSQFSTVGFPDNRILFCRKTGGAFHIFSSNPTGTTTVQLTDGPANNWRPRMNPQRTKIAFFSDENIEIQLIVMDRDGSGRQKITVLPVAGYNKYDLDFCWSPDGSRLLYMNQGKLYRINLDGSGLQLFASAPAGFTFTECDWFGSFTPKIAARTTGEYIFNSEILLFDELGVLQSTIIADTAGGLGGPMFSIDGTKILFTRDAEHFDAIDGRQINSEIFVKDLATGANVSRPSFLKPAGFNDLDARFTPDGAKVFFTFTSNDGISTRSLWTATLDGSTRTKLFDDAEMGDWR